MVLYSDQKKACQQEKCRIQLKKDKGKAVPLRPGVAQRVPGS